MLLTHLFSRVHAYLKHRGSSGKLRALAVRIGMCTGLIHSLSCFEARTKATSERGIPRLHSQTCCPLLHKNPHPRGIVDFRDGLKEIIAADKYFIFSWSFYSSSNSIEFASPKGERCVNPGTSSNVNVNFHAAAEVWIPILHLDRRICKSKCWQEKEHDLEKDIDGLLLRHSIFGDAIHKISFFE